MNIGSHRVMPLNWSQESVSAMPAKTVTRRLSTHLRAGDICYGRERWAAHADRDRLRPSQIPEGSPIWYGACHACEMDERRGKWRPPMFMLPWMSRRTHKIVSVRRDWLRLLSPDEALREGVTGDPDAGYAWPGSGERYATPQKAYFAWIGSLHRKGNIENLWINPLRRIEFQTVRLNIFAVIKALDAGRTWEELVEAER